MDTIKLTIDNREVEVPKGTTILKAAQSMGIDIPTLCHFEFKGMDVHNKPGGCRICVVEVEKRRNLAPACVTECMEGMVVRTNSIRVINARKTVLELILSDHPNDCLQCAKSGNCELQALAIRFGIRENPFVGEGHEQSTYQVEVSPSIIRDMNKCVMCRRCETMCNEMQTVGALSAIERGFPAVVSTAFNQHLELSPCRIGNKRLHEILVKITEGKGTMEDLEELRNLAHVIKDTALCGLGQTSPNPVLSTIDNFWDEYVAHVVDKKCPAGQCKALKQYVIDPDKCKGCTACARACPVGAIHGTVKNPHEIDQNACIKCGTCYEKCKFNAISIK